MERFKVVDSISKSLDRGEATFIMTASPKGTHSPGGKRGKSTHSPGTLSPLNDGKKGKKSADACVEFTFFVYAIITVFLEKAYGDLTQAQITLIEQKCTDAYNELALSQLNCGAESIVAIHCIFLPIDADIDFLDRRHRVLDSNTCGQLIIIGGGSGAGGGDLFPEDFFRRQLNEQIAVSSATEGHTNINKILELPDVNNY